MAWEIRMPPLGQTTDELAVVEWLVAVGDPVRVGQPLLSVQTDKAVLEVESTASGILTRQCYAPGDSVQAGEVVAVITKPGDPDPPAQISPVPEFVQRNRASPSARRLVREHGLDVAEVHAAAGKPVLHRADVLAVLHRADDGSPAPAATAPAAAGAPAPGCVTVSPLTPMRSAIAARTTESAGTIPHFYLDTSVDLSAVRELRARWEQEVGTPLDLNALLVRAVALAVAKVPQLQHTYRDGHLVSHPDIQVGLAVAVPGGVLMPVISGVAGKAAAALQGEIAGLVRRARSGQLTGMEMSGGTVSISNLGMFPVDRFWAIIPPGQSAILAVGRAADRPVVADGQVTVRYTVELTLAVDHRLCDGAEAATFVAELKELLEHPLRLLA